MSGKIEHRLDKLSQHHPDLLILIGRYYANVNEKGKLENIS
jgi:hypothetical protein